MIILNAYEPKILPVVPKSEWREPSVSMPRNWLGHKEWHTEFVITAKTKAGYTIWRGVFQDRDDADAFLYAAVRGTLRVEWALHDLPDPIYSPGFYPDELIVWQFAVTSYYTSGTSWTVPSDWNNSNNEIVAIGGGGNGQNGAAGYTVDKTYYPGAPGTGGGGGACSKITNQTYTAGASRTMAIGSAGADTSLKQNDNTTNAVLAKAGSPGASGGTGGQASSGTGATKYSGGNGVSAGGGAASTTANGSNPTSGDGAGTGANGTGLGSGYGSGGGGAANGGNAGNYGGGGGGGAGDEGPGGVGRAGLLVITHTPAAAAMNKGFNMPNGW